MIVLQSPQVMQETVLRWKRDSSIGLVPTMGALHRGHLSLVERIKSQTDKCIVSIFVNPKQFGPKEDLSKYPRPFEEDCAKLEALGVDAVFAPSPKEMYPDGFQTSVLLGSIPKHLCGASRPGHFDGVAVVCSKLFAISQADVAVFGEKDFQQLRLIEQLVSDLNLPVRILRGQLVRDDDGVALSSRNVYLSPSEREAATVLSRSLFRWQAQANAETTVGTITDEVRQAVTAAGLRVDYVEIGEEFDCAPVKADTHLGKMTAPRLFLAAFAGSTRLIDNAGLANREPQGAAAL